MRKTIALAHERGVSVGAHPSYPDRPGFGRREIGLPMDAILVSFADQVKAMMECCELEGARLRYVKPHGALYNRAARDEELAYSMVGIILSFDSSLMLLGLSGSMMETLSLRRGLSFAREAFIDRAYMADGSLVPRTENGAVLDDPQIAANRAIEVVTQKELTAIDGTRVAIPADSLCVHGDSRNAIETVTTARAALENSGYSIAPFAK
jgi:UPF0271 protein